MAKLSMAWNGARSRRAMLDTLIRHLDMVRLSLVASVLALVVSGCYGLLDEPNDGLTENQRKARAIFLQRAYDVMVSSCGGANCHTGMIIPFLEGATPLAVYETITKFKPELINKIDAAKSRILTKGPHAGPEFSTMTKEGRTSSDYDIVREWLLAEQRAAGDSTPTGEINYIVTEKIRPVVCMGARTSCQSNKLSLRGIRPDKTGVEGDIEFLYEVLPTVNAPYIVNLRVVAGAEGAFVESPIFLGYETGKTTPVVDADAFFDVKVNTPANMSKVIGAGFAGLTDIKALDGAQTNELAMSFAAIDKFKPEGSVNDPSACKQLAMWQAMVRPIMMTNCANGCHISTSGNGAARGSLTIDAANDAFTCQQAKRAAGTNLNNIPATPLYNAPRAGVAAGHDFKFAAGSAAQTNWETAVTNWLTAERTSN